MKLRLIRITLARRPAISVIGCASGAVLSAAGSKPNFTLDPQPRRLNLARVKPPATTH